MLDFALPPDLEAHEPPEPRDDVRLIAGTAGGVTHHPFTELPDLLRPGDLLVVNTSATLPAAIRLDRLTLHFSGPLPAERDGWLVELRLRVPFAAAAPRQAATHAARTSVLTGAMLLGTAAHDQLQIAQLLQAHGGELSVSADADRLLLSTTMLPDGLAAVLGVLAELLAGATYPAGPVDEIGRASCRERV